MALGKLLSEKVEVVNPFSLSISWIEDGPKIPPIPNESQLTLIEATTMIIDPSL